MDLLFVSLFLFSVVYALLLIFLQRSFKQCGAAPARFRPFVSIIVSMHNEAENVHGCLEMLTCQDYPADCLEILLINDRSMDQTGKILAEYEQKNKHLKVITIEEVPEDIAPKKYAITLAIREARGTILLFTDADGRPPAGWVSRIITYFDEKTGMVLGYAPYRNHVPYQTLIFRLLALEYLSHAAVAAATTCLGYPLTCVGTNMAYRKEIFQHLDGFGDYKNIHTGDDDLFLQRVRDETDWRIRYCPEAEGQVWNAPPVSWQQFYHQRLRYASKGLLYPFRVSLILVLFYFYNFLLFLSPLFLLSEPEFFLYFLFSVLLKAGADFYFLRQSARFLQDQRHLALFPLVFFLHIPYVLIFGLLSQVMSFEWAHRKSS